jgi:hypothetical protein
MNYTFQKLFYRLRWEQISVGIWFCIAVVTWITRDLFYYPGWNTFFKKGYLRNNNFILFLFFNVNAFIYI